MIGQIVKSVGFNKKKFFIFLILISCFLTGRYLWQTNFFKAEEPIPDNIATSNDETVLNYKLTLQGKLIDSDKKTVAQTDFEQVADSLRFVVIKQSDMLIAKQKVIIALPKADSSRAINAKINSDGSFGDQTIYYDKGDSSLIFEITDIAPSSTVSISLTIAKNYLDPKITDIARTKLTIVSFTTFVIIGSVIPLFTLITLIVMLVKSARRRVKNTRAPAVNAPPDKTSPAVVGVLYHGKIGPREIAATLLDLANRGYLHIYHDAEGFRFVIPTFLGDEKFKDIKPFEKFLLSKLFQPDKITSNATEIGYRIGRHLFSRKITAVLLDIYQQAVVNGYFTVNPARMHQKYKIVAIVEFFLGVLGLGASYLFLTDYKAIFLIIFASTIISSLLVFALAPTLPPRTEAGAHALKQWLAFRKFLTKPQPIQYSEQIQEVYMQYLPYAIVFQAEVDWAKRFSKSPFKMPEWLDSPTDITNVEDFANRIYPLVGYVGSIILQSRIPVMD